MPENTRTPRGRGRPKINPPNLSERFMVRVTPEEHALLASLAESDGRSLSSFARRAILAGVGQMPEDS